METVVKVEHDIHYIEFHDITQTFLDTYKIPSGTECMVIKSGYIRILNIPHGITECTCYGNLGIQYIHIPKSLTYLDCENQYIRAIHIPKNLINIRLSGNGIERISFEDCKQMEMIIFLDNNIILDISMFDKKCHFQQ